MSSELGDIQKGVFSILKQHVKGGLAEKKKLKPKDVDQKQLKMGIKVEHEHTPSKAIAREIAMDHLAEDPKYYTKLKTIEEHEGAERRKKVTKFYCPSCDRILKSKKATKKMMVKCGCGGHASKIVQKCSIGKLAKKESYEEKILNGTPYRSMAEFRMSGDAPYCEELKSRMLRKYGDLAVGDSVRPGKYLTDKIVGAIERLTNKELSDDDKSEVQNIEGTVSKVNVRDDKTFINWSDDAQSVAGKYNTDNYDFFDLDGEWRSYDLDRVIMPRDVGRVGNVNSDRGGAVPVG
jgi:hypothetical protein